ncbi:hypothetical protein BJV77DRAFT_1046878 [Russula vinacea]|nr:hypothetical protein BJV77DRAFT_1046878 [Russula vinacea]
MSYHRRTLLPVNAMTELMATDLATDGGHLSHRRPRYLGPFETLKTAIRSVYGRKVEIEVEV